MNDMAVSTAGCIDATDGGRSLFGLSLCAGVGGLDLGIHIAIPDYRTVGWRGIGWACITGFFLRSFALLRLTGILFPCRIGLDGVDGAVRFLDNASGFDRFQNRDVADAAMPRVGGDIHSHG